MPGYLTIPYTLFLYPDLKNLPKNVICEKYECEKGVKGDHSEVLNFGVSNFGRYFSRNFC